MILTIGLITVGLWLSVGFERKSYNNYLVYMKESVAGLSEESAVKFNGVKVGQVTNIEFSKVNPQQTKILIRVQQGTPVTTSTYATLITQGITGTTYLGLTPSGSTFMPLQRTPGEPYPVIPAKPSFFNQLQKNIKEISDGFKSFLTKENAANLNTALKELPKLVKDLRSSSHEFNQLAESMAETGDEVTSTMKAGKDSIDKISQQALPPAIILLRRLDVIASNLEKVSEQMRQNPGVLIRGTAPQRHGPGE
jgi:phospholipid/cholesterol/gamma-HCH transport system substrate-binding protein